MSQLMRLFAKLPLANRLSSLWNGPEDLPRNLKLEWRFVAVRWLTRYRVLEKRTRRAIAWLSTSGLHGA